MKTTPTIVTVLTGLFMAAVGTVSFHSDTHSVALQQPSTTAPLVGGTEPGPVATAEDVQDALAVTRFDSVDVADDQPFLSRTTLWAVGDLHRPGNFGDVPAGLDVDQLIMGSMSFLRSPGVGRMPKLTDDNVDESAKRTAARVRLLLSYSDGLVALDIENVTGWSSDLEWRFLDRVAELVGRDDMRRVLVWAQVRGRQQSPSTMLRTADCRYYGWSGGVLQPLYIGRPMGPGGVRTAEWVAGHSGLKNAEQLARYAGVPLYGVVNVHGLVGRWKGEALPADHFVGLSAVVRTRCDGLVVWGTANQYDDAVELVTAELEALED